MSVPHLYIGNQGAGDEFQTIRIGTAQTQTFIAGIANTSVPNDAVVVIDTVTGQLGTASPSSARVRRETASAYLKAAGIVIRAARHRRARPSPCGRPSSGHGLVAGSAA